MARRSSIRPPIDATLADLTGVPTAAFFRSSAIDRPRRARGPRSRRRDAARAARRIDQRRRPRARRRPSRSSSGSSRTSTGGASATRAGSGSPRRPSAVRRPWSLPATPRSPGWSSIARRSAAAEAASEAATADLDGRRILLEQARDAERLTAEQAAATERHARYAEAVTAAAELARLHDSHPSPNPLPVVRQTVERLRVLETKMAELRAMLSGEVKVDVRGHRRPDDLATDRRRRARDGPRRDRPGDRRPAGRRHDRPQRRRASASRSSG